MSENITRWPSLVCGVILGGIALLFALLSPAFAQTWTLTTLYSFCAEANCTDGQKPGYGSLVADKLANLYGTTENGGANFAGTVFALAPSGEETVLHSFCSLNNCGDGQRPLGGVILGAGGVLYGTTYGHGSLMSNTNPGGAVFKIPPKGKESVLCKLGSAACPVGEFPVGSLIADGSGNLYGTTSWGGTNPIADFDCCGAVFKISSGEPGVVLYSFCSLADCHDGARPEAGLIADAFGNLYGTTVYGGFNTAGIVFEIAPGSTEKVIYSFCAADSCADGAYPEAGLVMDGSGNLYGTTLYGGAKAKGTVFEVTPGGVEKVLYSFCSVAACADGEYPHAVLIFDASGNLYGTTQSGGANGKGTVFMVAPSGQETVIYSFCAAAGCVDGKSPLAGLLMDKSGNLYGTTSGGGANGKGGTVFELAPPAAD